MTDKPPYVPATNDLYYNCLDVVLAPEPDPPIMAVMALVSLLGLRWARLRATREARVR
jgi:hypothetical protein